MRHWKHWRWSEVMTAGSKLGESLRTAQAQQQVVPCVGVYDLFSSSLADSAFRLPDVGFIGWGDLPTTSFYEPFCPITTFLWTSALASLLPRWPAMGPGPWSAAMLRGWCY